MADMHSSNAHGADRAETHHEESDVNFGGVLGFGGALIAVCAVVFVVALGLFRYLEVRQATTGPAEFPMAATEGARLPPEPRLQTNPRQDLRDMRDQEEQTLHSYGWVDRNAGVVRIPIDEAIKLTLERGLPARQAPRP
jgi:hypothetical protein